MILSTKAVASLWRRYVRLTVHLYILAALLVLLFHYTAHPMQLLWTVGLAVALIAEQSIQRVLDAHSIRRAAKLARREHAQFHAAAEGSQEVFFLCKPVTDAANLVVDFRFTYVNAAAAKLFGKGRLDLLGKSTSGILPAASKLRVMGAWARVAATGTSETLEMVIEAQGVAPSKRETRVTAISEGIAVTVLRDKQDEVAAKRLLEMQEFTQAIIQSAPVSMIATDINGTVMAMNSAAERLTFYRKSDLVGEHSIVLLHDALELSSRSVQLSKALGEPIEAGFQSLIANPQSEKPEEREWTYIRKDGGRVWVNLSMTTLKTSEGKVTGYLGIAFDVTERRRLTDSMVHMAQHDQLTGLPNRTLLKDRMVQGMERARRYGHKMAVFMVDIDHYKRINDSLGHTAGDTLLTLVGRQLQSAVRRTDTVARLDGDEFVVFMPEFRDLEDAKRCASLLLQKLSTPIMLGQHEIRVTGSIGYCLYPDNANDPSELLRIANIAMYEAKNLGRNHAQLFNPDMEQHVTDKLQMEEELRYALQNDEFELHYQPQVSCTHSGVIGMELLLRWRNPKRGFVSPVVFIPIAEESGLLIEIGEWAIRQACFDCVAMQKQLEKRLTVAVNLSPRQFSQRSLRETVKVALEDSGLSPHDLELEITEQILMTNTPNVMATLEELHELGVNIAIDDFGTGFSSFSYILEYNVDRLKIDQSFIAKAVHDNGAAAVVRTIIAMAHGLKIDVVAEGVETIEQMNFLMRKRCDAAQGFFFSRAVPIDEFVPTVKRIENWVMSQRSMAAQVLENKGKDTEMKALPGDCWQANMIAQ